MKAWEIVEKKEGEPQKGTLQRIGKSKWCIEPYEYGFIVAKMRDRSKDGWVRTVSETAKYPSDVHGLVRVISGLGHVLDGNVVKGIDEAIKGQILAGQLAIEAAKLVQEAVSNAKTEAA